MPYTTTEFKIKLKNLLKIVVDRNGNEAYKSPMQSEVGTSDSNRTAI